MTAAWAAGRGNGSSRRAARTSVGPARATYVVQPGRRTSGPVAGQGASRAAGGQRDSRGFARTWAPPPLAANIIASMDRAARFGARTLCEAAQATPERASGGTGRVAGGGAAGGLTGFSRVARRFPRSCRSNRRATLRPFSGPRPLRETPLPAISTLAAAPSPLAVRRAAVAHPFHCTETLPSSAFVSRIIFRGSQNKSLFAPQLLASPDAMPPG